MDREKVATYLIDDVRLWFCNTPEVEGKQASPDGLSRFWETIRDQRYDFVEV